MFVSPAADYLLVGGGLTIPIFVALYFWPSLTPVAGGIPTWSFVAVNGAHFAASTVRLYTKPGARREFPVLAWIVPLACLLVVGVGLFEPRVGGQIKALYFTWSPFHYAAQTYGLAVMYAMRSGARLDANDKRQMRIVCLLPFVHAFFTTPVGGLFWFISRETIASMPLVAGACAATVLSLRLAVMLLPLSLFWQLRRRRGRQVPLISLLLQITSGIWWLGSDYLNAWFWTALFHSLQYLVIVTMRHIDERVPDRRRAGRFAAMWHGTTFYAASLAVGWALFFAVPSVYHVAFGFPGVECYAMMTLVINLHHFIVDGFIWRSPRRASEAASPLPEAAVA